MKKNFLLFILFSLNTILSAQNNEFRATWVITWDYISESKTVDDNKARIIQILENHKKANLNAVIWQVRQDGLAYYNSKFEPWGKYTGYRNPGFDPLEFAVAEAHKRGLEIHAWFNTFKASSVYSGAPATLHPDWICTNSTGGFMSKNMCLSPGLEEVRAYTLNVAMEVIKNYDIDGFHLDYIRWNEYTESDMLAKTLSESEQMDGNVTEKQLKNINSGSRYTWDAQHPNSAGIPAGFASWDDWRRAGVTDFVRRLHDSIQAVKPWVRLSAATLGKYKDGGTTGWNGYYVVYQDAALWFNNGYIDQLMPMHYHWTTGDGFFNELTNDWEPYIQAGIAAKRMYSVGPGSYILAEQNVWKNHANVIARCREKSWVDGFQFFSYATWENYNYWSESANSFFRNPTKMRNIKTIPAPTAPQISIQKQDSMHYQLTVTPTSSDNCWYAIYRSEDAIFNSVQDQLVDLHFGKITYVVAQVYNGLQDFGGSYHYYATALNRFWNESPASNVAITDAVPSFAAVVSFTNPMPDATIKVKDAITITFSKAMTTLNFKDHLVFSPAFSNFNLGWSADNKTVTITPILPLAFETEYTITVKSTAKDLNGKFLDGDKDGKAGGDFAFKFKTEPKDIIPPIVISSFPSANEIVDIASVIGVVYDKKVDAASISAGTIEFKTESTSVPFQFALNFTSDKKSILSIQPTQKLLPGKAYTIRLLSGIKDTLGNITTEPYELNFTTKLEEYASQTELDNFNAITGWKSPSYSGNTVGIVPEQSSFEKSLTTYLPATDIKSSACLKVKWSEGATTTLIREYLLDGPLYAKEFDINSTLQVYVFGDGSNTQFRFCIDDLLGTVTTDHEVSNWITINWLGWRLVEWKLSDPSQIGTWIGNKQLTSPKFRIDSYQFSRGTTGAGSGILYFDNFSLVRKIPAILNGFENALVDAFNSQIYPNPASNRLNFDFTLLRNSMVSLQILNSMGQIVWTNSFQAMTGLNHQEIAVNDWKTGIYIIKLTAENSILRKKLVISGNQK